MSLASVGNATAFGCTVVSTINRGELCGKLGDGMRKAA
jgi:hypothetical protein